MPQLTTNKLGETLMVIGTVHNKHSARRYSMRALPSAALRTLVMKEPCLY